MLQKSDTDITYRIEPHFIHIQTTHFTKFIVTKTGKIEEITELLLTVAAKPMTTQAKSVTCLRVMIHTGLSKMVDFADRRKEV